jgi:AraC-like DNA-binding protein
MTRTVLRRCRRSSAAKLNAGTRFANDLSIDELAVQAQMSRSHFALTFQRTQNKDHKDCQKPPFLYEQD